MERALHRTIKQVSEQVPELHYNTAIAAMMEYLNEVRADGRTPKKTELEPLVVMLAPFAPHIAEELYERLGHTEGLFGSASWPDYDPAKTVTESVQVAVQVNGKMRGRITVPVDATEEAVVAAARAQPNVRRHLEAGEVRRVIHVPGRLLNVVVG